MCGRYAASANPDDLVEEFEAVVRPEESLAPDYNVAPTKKVYAVMDRRPRGEPDAEPRRELAVVTWGLVPSWAKDPSIGSRMINARMETVAEKPAFKRAFAKRRCLLPADGGILAMAGLYELWRDPTRADDDPLAWRMTTTVLTTTAEDAVGMIHDRMPLFVERERWHDWLDPSLDGSTSDLTALLVPAAPGRLDAYPVSTAVNAVRNNGPELVEPIAAEDATEPDALF